jgi:tetratricopeptide (TPR) repeat protein
MNQSEAEVRRLIAEDRFEEALRACENALAARPNDLQLVLLKSWILSTPVPEVTAPEAAVALLTEQIRSTPEVPDLHLALAQAYATGLGDYSAAVQEYRETLRLQPYNADACLGLVLLVDAPGSGLGIEEAAESAARVATRSPAHWQLWRESGLLYWRLGRLADAEAAFRASLAHLPEGHDEATQILRWLSQVSGGTRYGDR